MSDADRDLVLAIRAELAAIDPNRPCDRRAEAIGLSGLGVARDGPLARLLLRLAGERAALTAAAGARPGDGSAREMTNAVSGFDWDVAAEHCRLAWLRGLFLARG